MTLTPPQPSRRRFTLRDLLVTGTILAVLFGLGAVGFNRARDVGRQNTCRSWLRSLTLATIQFEKQQQHYPGYVQTVNGQDQSWGFMILPQLERSDIYDRYEDGTAGQPTEDYSLFRCPSVPERTNLGWPAANYVVNTGLPDVPPAAPGDPPPDWQANGVFHDQRDPFGDGKSVLPLSQLTEAYVSTGDGSTNTVMLSENLDARSWSLVGAGGYERQLGMVWSANVGGNPPQPSPPDSLRIDHGVGDDPTFASINFARPSSNHPGLINVSFCDGHVRTISKKINYLVWCLLMTPRGKESRLPGRDAKGAEGPPVDKLFRTTVLDEKKIE